MKKLIIVLACLLSLPSMASEIQVKVSGMVCSLCAQGIKKNFSKLKEVKSINVDLDQKIVTINTLDNEDLTDKKITKIITEAGYNVTTIQR